MKSQAILLYCPFLHCYLNIHLLQMKLNRGSPKYNEYKSVSRTWQNYAANFKGNYICGDQVLATYVFCKN